MGKLEVQINLSTKQVNDRTVISRSILHVCLCMCVCVGGGGGAECLYLRQLVQTPNGTNIYLFFVSYFKLWLCHTYPRSPWRSHCDLKSTEAWGKAQYGL